MRLRSLKRVEKIILISFGFSILMMVGLWVMDKEDNRDFYLPTGHEGWVTIRYEVADAPPLAYKDGNLQIVIPANGIVETSSRVTVGWRKDSYFWRSSAGDTPIPSSIKKDGEYYLYLSRHEYYTKDHLDVLKMLQSGQDTLLADNTRISRGEEQEVSYEKGRKTLEYFYISAEPKSIMFVPPPLESEEALLDDEDRQIRVD
ncbi:MAG: hypothetical protein AB8H47_01200 [Bacteroidia bacterium]